jgi:peroxiredoxin
MTAQLGDVAPPIALPDHDGVAWRLEDRRGRSVIVIFHRHLM